MSETVGAKIIPARITAVELAQHIGRQPDAILSELRTRGEPNADDEFIGAELAIEIAASLGVVVSVEARDLALERLYEYETKGAIESDAGGRAGAMVEGVVSDLDDLDGMIESVAEHWSVARMPVIDRNIIRIGLLELRDEPSTPTAVIVAEAVRLAQTYSTEKSAAFVNGVMATLAKALRGD